MAGEKQLSDGRSSGWKLGQSASDKGAFFGAAPVVQQTSPTVSALTTMTATTTALAAAMIVVRQALRDVNTALENLGLTA